MYIQNSLIFYRMDFVFAVYGPTGKTDMICLGLSNKVLNGEKNQVLTLETTSVILHM